MFVFSSFLCPKLDLDLLPCWVRHYVEFMFDEYVVFVHRVDGDDEAAAIARDLFVSEGFTVHEVRGEYDNGMLQEYHLKRFRDTLGKDDVHIVADSDEIQDMPYSYRELAREYDVIRGKLVDRWDDVLHEIIPGIPLSQQYPHSGDIYEIIGKANGLSTPEWRFNCPKSKILASRAGIPVLMNGSHYIGSAAAHGAYKVLEHQSVLHFTWRPGVIARVSAKSYVPVWYIEALLDLFKLGPQSDEYRMVQDRITERQRLMGWEPVAA